MGRKDTMEKEFMADNEIFADVVNGIVFDGYAGGGKIPFRLRKEGQKTD